MKKILIFALIGPFSEQLDDRFARVGSRKRELHGVATGPANEMGRRHREAGLETESEEEFGI